MSHPLCTNSQPNHPNSIFPHNYKITIRAWQRRDQLLYYNESWPTYIILESLIKMSVSSLDISHINFPSLSKVRNDGYFLFTCSYSSNLSWFNLVQFVIWWISSSIFKHVGHKRSCTSKFLYRPVSIISLCALILSRVKATRCFGFMIFVMYFSNEKWVLNFLYVRSLFFWPGLVYLHTCLKRVK